MKKYQAVLIIISVALGVPAIIFSIVYGILYLCGVTGEDLMSYSIGIAFGLICAIFKVWKDSPYNVEGERKRQIIRDNIKTWNRMHWRECRRMDREEARKIDRLYGADDGTGGISDADNDDDVCAPCNPFAGGDGFHLPGC